ncbi:MAG: polysaccharide biosynthesis/export family protein [Planctomycetaceae bacterium]
MPHSLRLMAQSNPQEADLTRLAAATGGSETIGPGDVLEVTLSASLSPEDQMRVPTRVADDGTAMLPQIGIIQLGGVEPPAAESLIRAEAMKRGLYRNPHVTVVFTHKRMNKIKVFGAVKEPQVVELPPNSSDIASAIAAAGGLAENAGENVRISNPRSASRPAYASDPTNPTTPYSTASVSQNRGSSAEDNTYTVSLTKAATSADGASSYLLRDGGMVMVEKRDPAPVTVMGLVKKSGPIEFPVGKDFRLLDAIGEAGISNQLANKVFVVRPLANSSNPAVIEISLRQAKRSGASNIRLGPGDVVSVEQTPATVLLDAMQIIRLGVSGSAPLF